jgi:quercetin dioxygenase-like cupin family protein
VTPTFIDNVARELPIPLSGLANKLLLNDDSVRIVAFAFAAGHELKEHTAPVPVVLHFLQGEATVTLGDQVVDAQAGSLIHIPAKLTHAILARTAVVMTLLMLKRG